MHCILVCLFVCLFNTVSAIQFMCWQWQRNEPPHTLLPANSQKNKTTKAASASECKGLARDSPVHRVCAKTQHAEGVNRCEWFFFFFFFWKRRGFICGFLKLFLRWMNARYIYVRGVNEEMKFNQIVNQEFKVIYLNKKEESSLELL